MYICISSKFSSSLTACTPEWLCEHAIGSPFDQLQLLAFGPRHGFPTNDDDAIQSRRGGHCTDDSLRAGSTSVSHAHDCAPIRVCVARCARAHRCAHVERTRIEDTHLQMSRQLTFETRVFVPFSSLPCLVHITNF